MNPPEQPSGGFFFAFREVRKQRFGQRFQAVDVVEGQPLEHDARGASRSKGGYLLDDPVA